MQIQFGSDTNLTHFLNELDEGYCGDQPLELDFDFHKGIVELDDDFGEQHPEIFELMHQYSGYIRSN